MNTSFPCRFIFLLLLLPASTPIAADDKLALEVHIDCQSARLNQQILVAENAAFRVVTRTEGVDWTISGQVASIVNDAVHVTLRIDADDGRGVRFSAASPQSRRLKLDTFVAPSNDPHQLLAVGVWIHRGLDAAPALVRAIERRDEGLDAAVRQLAACDGDTKTVLGVLLKVLADKPLDDGRQASRSIRVVAAEALGNRNREATSAVPGLTAATKDANLYVRHAAAVALWEIDRDENAMRTLIELLGGQDARVLYLAAGTVEQIGGLSSDVVNAIPALSELLTNDDQLVRLAAARALLPVGEKEAALDCLEELSANGDDGKLRRLAKHVLERHAAGYRPDPLPDCD